MASLMVPTSLREREILTRACSHVSAVDKIFGPCFPIAVPKDKRGLV